MAPRQDLAFENESQLSANFVVARSTQGNEIVGAKPNADVAATPHVSATAKFDPVPKHFAARFVGATGTSDHPDQSLNERADTRPARENVARSNRSIHEIKVRAERVALAEICAALENEADRSAISSK